MSDAVDGLLRPSVPLQSRSTIDISFADRFHEVLQPVEELLIEWWQDCGTSADTHQTILALLAGSEMYSDTRWKLVRALVNIMQQSENTQLLSYPSLQHHEQEVDLLTSFAMPDVPIDFSWRPELVDELARGDESPLAAVLAATEEYSSALGLADISEGIAQQPQQVVAPPLVDLGALDPSWSSKTDTSSPYNFLRDADSPPRNRFDMLPTLSLPSPFSSAASPSTYSSIASSPSASTSSGSSSYSLSPSRDRSSTILPPRNGREAFVLVRQPRLDSAGHPIDSTHIHTVIYDLILVQSEPYSDPFGTGLDGRIVTLHLSPAEDDRDLIGLGTELKVVQLQGSSVMLYPCAAVKGDLKIFHFPPLSISEVDGARIGSTEWWRSQVCMGDHRSASARRYWTCHFETSAAKTRRYRVIAHFKSCRKGNVSAVLRKFARSMG